MSSIAALPNCWRIRSRALASVMAGDVVRTSRKSEALKRVIRCRWNFNHDLRPGLPGKSLSPCRCGAVRSTQFEAPAINLRRSVDEMADLEIFDMALGEGTRYISDFTASHRPFRWSQGCAGVVNHMTLGADLVSAEFTIETEQRPQVWIRLHCGNASWRPASSTSCMPSRPRKRKRSPQKLAPG